MSLYLVELQNFQEYIKINVKDTLTLTTYEKILWEFDIKDSHFKTLDKTSFFFEKCIDNNNYQNYTYQIEEVNEQILLTFKANIDELINIETKYLLDKITINEHENESSVLTIRDIENKMILKMNEKIKELEEKIEDERNRYLVKINELENKLKFSNVITKIQQLYNIISACEIPIYDDLPNQQRVPLSLNFLHINFYGHDHKKPNIDNINKLFNLKKLNISIERNFGYLNSYNFDIRLFNNYVLEELLLTNYSYYDKNHNIRFTTIECLTHLKTLKKIQLSCCEGLVNISDYLHNFSNLNFLKIHYCPGIIAHDKIKLEKYCSENNIELIIS